VSRREVLLVYRHPRVLAMLFLGFSAGLPFLLIFSTLSVWLREADISRTEIGFFSWIGISADPASRQAAQLDAAGSDRHRRRPAGACC
jgi:hypothetical protein